MTSILMSEKAVIIGLAAWAALTPCHAEEIGLMPAQAPEIVVTRASHECFTSLIHASGYLVPRQSAVVMLAAPGYRIIEVRAKLGDMVKRGDVVARAALPAANPAATPPTAKPGVGDGLALTALASGMVLRSTAFEGTSTAASIVASTASVKSGWGFSVVSMVPKPVCFGVQT